MCLMSPDSPAKVRLAPRRSADRPRWSADEARALALAQKAIKLATSIVDAAIAEVAFEGPKDPKIIGLALLYRSISNCKARWRLRGSTKR
jgi:hypothetical protein